MANLFSFSSIIPFITLFALELVLGIDNIIFVSILSSRLPSEQQGKARVMGLGFAVFTRVGLLLSLSWIVGLTEPLFSVAGVALTGRALVLLIGGLFLITKSTREIHHKIETAQDDASLGTRYPKFWSTIIQIVILDIVFSLDSVITAVGMVNDIGIMIAAVLASTLVMMIASGTVSRFVDRHPTLKMLALSFLLLIGVTLIADALGQPVSKGYIYFAMGFSLFVETLNIKLSSRK